MDGTSSFLVRTVRLAWPGGSPLARAVDRLDALVLIVAVAVGLVLVPVMLAIGVTVRANVLETGAQQAATRHAAVATLTADAPRAGTSAGGYGGADTGRSGVPARWQAPSGAGRTGPVQAKDGLRAGAKVDVWLDEGGHVVAAPVAPADATVAGMMAGLLGWLAAAGLLTLVRTGVHHALDRRRYREWDREWARMATRSE